MRNPHRSIPFLAMPLLFLLGAPLLANPSMSPPGAGKPGGLPHEMNPPPALREVTAPELWEIAKPIEGFPGARAFSERLLVKEEGLLFESGGTEDWDKYYFDPKDGPRFKKVLQDDSRLSFADLDQIFQGMKGHEKKVLFLDSGFLIIFTQDRGFLLKITPSTVEKIRGL